MKDEDIKKVVKEKYSEIALNVKSDCGCGCCGGDELYGFMKEDYEGKDGYVTDADLGLGCGVPTDYAGIKYGDVVLDLGSGAGNDVFIASKLVGDTGKVIGLDMTEEMIEKAEQNKKKLGITNVEFRLGEIENMPIGDNSIDVVLSNCVLNLVPDKQKAFSEIYRVLKSGARFCVSDIVLEGELSDKIKKIAELYAGCVAGSSQFNDYLAIIESTGFKDVKIHKKREIQIPKKLLSEYLNDQEIEEFLNSNVGIFSITISAVK